ncbi:MAG: NAD(+) synthase [Bacillota bacterium]
MKLALGQMQVIPGRPDINTQTMRQMIEEAKNNGAHIVVFPKLCISGYLLGDTWEQTAFLKDCENWGKKIIELSQDICIIFGNVAVDWNKTDYSGRVRKYNACFIAYQGRLWGKENFPYPFRIKTFPDSRGFDEIRHFFSLTQLAGEMGVSTRELLQPVKLFINGKPFHLGCLLCEDGWSNDNALNPMAALAQSNPIDLFVNISSSPFTLGKNQERNRVFSRLIKEIAVPLAYVNCTGIQNSGKTVYSFDGLSSLYNREGKITAVCPAFTSMLKYTDLCHLDPTCNQEGKTVLDLDWDIDYIYQALYYGTKHFLASIGMKKVVIGLSGGIDSAVNACLYREILGAENVLLVNMPSIYNSETTKNLAAKLAQNLGCYYTIIPIQESVDLTVRQLEETPVTNLSGGENINIRISPFHKENIQARDRSARILAGLASAFEGGFTCNANKSEITVGYSTLYGDQAGFLAALGDLWKHQVYDLARYFNEKIYKREVIPQEMIDLVPSAELSPNQNVDEGKGDPIHYPYHDYLFRSFMEHRNQAAPEDILTWYLEGTLEKRIGCRTGLVKELFPKVQAFIKDLEYWWRQFTGMGVAKRIQAPPVLAVSRKAYGSDFPEAQNQPYFTAKYLELKNKILKNLK